jgi:hypothetical protein
MILLLLLACGGERSYEAEESAGVAPPMAAPDMPARDFQAPQAPAPMPTERRVVRNAQLSIVVDDTRPTAERLVRLADSLGGYASEVRADRRDELMYYHIALRVPAPRLDEAVAAIKAQAIRVESEALQTEDVTEQVVDLEARRVTLVATEEELRALLAESRSRRSDVEEIMAIYRELTGIRTQIEQIQAQLEMLERRVALSTITIELAPEAGSGPLVSDRWRPGGTVRSAVRTLVAVLQGLVDVAIYAAIVILPILVILAVPIVLIVLLLRRRFRRRTAG